MRLALHHLNLTFGLLTCAKNSTVGSRLVTTLVLCEYSKFRIESNKYTIQFKTSTIIQNF